MRPVLFTWRGRAVPSYPAMLYLGLVLGLAAGNVAAHAGGLDGARVYVASLLLVVPALVGARLASVVMSWSAFREAPGRIWRRSEGGQVMYGGLVAVPLSVPLLAVLRLPFWAFWDVATFTMLTGMVFTRMGCLLTGCCAGRPTESRFGLVLTDRRGVRARRVPTQLLEAGLGAILLVGASVLAAAHAPPGSVFAGSLAGYAVGRLFLEPLREHQSRVAGVSALRAASVALLVIVLSSILPRLV
jgi:phosphatidylglycerol---prolipoprotein diacylglyceryl transferase